MLNLSNLIKNRALLLSTVALIAFGGTGLALYSPNAKAETPAEAAPAAPANAALPVSVQTVTPQNVRIWTAFSARLQAVDYAEIRPQISGRIMEVRFTDGQMVKAGDVLFVIDPATAEAALAKAEAKLVSAQTNAAFAKTEANRAANLVQTQAIAKRLYDERANANRVAQADILVAEAEVKQARIDVDHAYVKAPISGRVSRAEITVGNLVQATTGAAPLLTSIVSNDGIYADFEVDEQTYLSSIRSKANTQAEEKSIPVELTIKGNEDAPYKGTIYSFDNKIDTASGTIRARAKFANEEGHLMPGMFASVKLASTNDDAALLVPERAIGNDQSKKFVYIVDSQNKVAYREVSLGQKVNDQRIVLSGVQAGDRVVVDGLQQIKPDSLVLIKEAAANVQQPQKLAAN